MNAQRAPSAQLEALGCGHYKGLPVNSLFSHM